MDTCFSRIMNLNESLDDEDIVELGRLKPNAFIRNRKLSFKDLINIILNKKGLTQVLEIYNYYMKKGTEGVSKQAFSKSRKNLNPNVFKQLNDNYISNIYENTEYKTFMGRIVLGIDGSVQKFVFKDELAVVYGGTAKNGVINSVNAKSTGIYDVLNNVMIDFSIAPYKTSEKELAKGNIENAEEFFENSNDLLMLFDRGFASIELFNYLNKKRIDFICRLKKIAYKEEKAKMKSLDECIDINITDNRLQRIKNDEIKKELKKKGKLRLRLVKITLPSGEEEHLITNLYKDEVSYEQINSLYQKRWEIEKSFDVLKNKLYIENLSGYSQIAVEQDFYSQILLYNIVQDIKNEANKDIKLKKTHENTNTNQT